MSALERLVRVIFKGENEVSGPAKEAESSILSVGTVVKQLGAAFAALAVGEFFKRSIEEAQNSREAMGQLALAVTNSGASWSKMSPAVDATLDRLSRLTKFQDDDFARSMQEMTVSTGDAQWSLSALGLVADVAAAKNIDLSTAADVLAKAHEGNTKQLDRMFPSLKGVTNWQEALAEATKDAAEKQMQQLGPTAAIEKQFGEFAESVGKAILGNEQFSTSGFGVADMLAGLAHWIDENSAEIGKFIDGAITFGKNLWDGIQPVVSLVSDVMMPVFAFVFRSVVVALEEASFAVRAYGVKWEDVVGSVIQAVAGMLEKGVALLKRFGITVGDGIVQTMQTYGQTMQWEANAKWAALEQDHDAFWTRMTTASKKGNKGIEDETKAHGQRVKKIVEEDDNALVAGTGKTKAQILKDTEELGKKIEDLFAKGGEAAVKNSTELRQLFGTSLTVSLSGAADAIGKIRDKLIAVGQTNAPEYVQQLTQRSQGYVDTLNLMNDAHKVLQAANYGLPPKDAAAQLQTIIDKLQEQAVLEMQSTGNAADYEHRLDTIRELMGKVVDFNEKNTKTEKDAEASRERSQKAMESMVSNAADIARSALDLAQAFGIVDAKAASALNSAINIGVSLSKLAGGDWAGGITGIVGGIANIVGMMVQGDPERRTLMRENNARLQYLAENGVTLSDKASGESISKAKDVFTPGFAESLAAMASMPNHGDVRAMNTLMSALNKAGLRVSDLDKIANDLGMNIRDKNGNLSFDALVQLVQGMNMPGFGTSIGQSFTDQFNFFKTSQRLSGASGMTQITGLASFLKDVGHVKGLEGIDFSNASGARSALFNLLTQLNNGGLDPSLMGRLTGQQFQDILVQLIDSIDSLASGSTNTSGSSTGTGDVSINVPPPPTEVPVNTTTLTDVVAAITLVHDDAVPILSKSLEAQLAIQTNTFNTVEELRMIREALEATGVLASSDDAMGRRLMQSRLLAGNPSL